jgi:hypothetical protein
MPQIRSSADFDVFGMNIPARSGPGARWPELEWAMNFAKRAARSSVATLLLGALTGACVEQPTDDDPEAEAPELQCCIVQKICANCVCDNSTIAIGKSNNEAACETFLDDQDNFGCDLATTNGMRYREVDAIADCAE